jgi:serine/threonine protein kinase
VVLQDGPLAPRAVAKIGVALLGALEVAHAAGVLHRDVKPANVLICTDGRCVLTDFGVARMPSDQQLTTPGMVLGSPRVPSEEALRIGLLDEVVDADTLLDRAIQTVHAWTPEGGTTALHLALLRPLLAEVEAAFEREDAAAHEAWTSGLLTAGVAGFWNTKSTQPKEATA